MPNPSKQIESNIAPFHQQPWFWFVISPLIVVFIACAITVSIAVRNSDDLVVGDYYKEGLLINERLDAREVALRYGLSADAQFYPNENEVRIQLQSDQGEVEAVFPESLLLLLSHPSDAKQDFQLTLTRRGVGSYAANLPVALHNRWYLTLAPVMSEVQEQTSFEEWRLVGRIDFSSSSTSALTPP